jgi:hypothetical protein
MEMPITPQDFSVLMPVSGPACSGIPPDKMQDDLSSATSIDAAFPWSSGPLKVILAWVSSRHPCALPPPAPLIYNALVLAFALGCMTVMTWIFFVGIAGSLLVIIISFFEDLNELIGKE